MKKDKLLRRLSAMQFAMWEMREFLDTHPNCPDAKALYNACLLYTSPSPRDRG